jgi:hypothetical protein
MDVGLHDQTTLTLFVSFLFLFSAFAFLIYKLFNKFNGVKGINPKNETIKRRVSDIENHIFCTEVYCFKIGKRSS